MTGIVAVIGAECSGKTSLAVALAQRLGGDVVPEELRCFVDQHGRAPRAAEQAGVMQRQVAAEAAAASRGGWIISDAAVLMTAAYSLLYYGDDALLAPALAHHRRAYVATLWCDIDIAWRADGAQRDGPQLRDRGHQLLTDVLAEHALPVVVVRGTPATRLRTALAVLGASGQ